mgnify:CR=1 FL=1
MIKDVNEETILKMEETLDHYQRQYSSVRTGRANSALVEHIKVDYYGTPTPIKQVAKISIPEPTLIVIQPWDASVTTQVEKAIQKSDTGLVPNSDGKLIRINIPALTEERRQQLVKVVKKMTEEGRVALRNIRREANDQIKQILKDKEVTEDEAHKGYDEIQKLTDDYIKKLDAAGLAKEKEILDF